VLEGGRDGGTKALPGFAPLAPIGGGKGRRWAGGYEDSKRGN